MGVDPVTKLLGGGESAHSSLPDSLLRRWRYINQSIILTYLLIFLHFISVYCGQHNHFCRAVTPSPHNARILLCWAGF